MKHIISAAKARALDKKTREALAIEDVLLMEKASLRLWSLLQTIIQKEQPRFFVFLCGKGDNGGDGMAIARHAWSSGVEKEKLQVIVPKEEGSEASQRQLKSLKAIGISVTAWEKGCLESIASKNSGKTAIIDSVLGTGSSGQARGTALEMIDSINSLSENLGSEKAFVVSIDVPSGLGDGWMEGFSAVRADYTLTLDPAKQALYDPAARLFVGKISIAEDVFPYNMVKTMSDGCLMETADISENRVHLSGDAYKISRGRVTIFAGTIGTLGAALLCAKATQAAGAGYVQFFTQDEAYMMSVSAMPAIMTKPESAFNMGNLKADTIIAGPGWGKSAEHAKMLKKLLELDLPLVLDADALRILAENVSLNFLPIMQKRTAPLVLTPHPGEFESLVQRYIAASQNLVFAELLARVAETLNAIIVYKSHVTWIYSPKGKAANRFSIWDGQCPGLGTAGSGDVLAGFLAGDLAIRSAADKKETYELWDLALESARQAVVCHGYAGRLLYETQGWFSASELLPFLKKLSCEAAENKNKLLDDSKASG